MVIHHTLLAKSTDSTWPAISLAIGSSKSQISTIHHNLQSSHIIHYFSLPICAGRDSTRENTEVWVEDVEKRLLWINTFNHMRGMKCDEWMLSENHILPTIQLFTMFTKCWVNLGEFTNMLPYFFLHPKGTRKDQINWHWNIHMVSCMMAFESGTGLDMFWKTVETIHILGYIISILYKTIYIYVTRIDHKSILYDMGMDQYLWKYHF